MKVDLSKLKKTFSGGNLRKGLQETLSGDMLLKDQVRAWMPMAILLCALAFVYIDAGYRTRRQHKQMAELNAKIEDLHYKYLTLSAELMEQSRQSYIVKRLQENGSKVKASATQPITIDN